MIVNSIRIGDDMAMPSDDVTEDDLTFIAQALTPLAPPPQVQARVLAQVNQRIAGLRSQAQAARPSTLRTLRSEDGDWRALAPNVEFKVLHDDGKFTSMLVRLQPGARMPPHDHPRDEECYVIQGDIWLSGVHLQAGDFQFAGTDVVHDGIHSEHGCLLHIRAASEVAAALA